MSTCTGEKKKTCKSLSWKPYDELMTIEQKENVAFEPWYIVAGA